MTKEFLNDWSFLIILLFFMSVAIILYVLLDLYGETDKKSTKKANKNVPKTVKGKIHLIRRDNILYPKQSIFSKISVRKIKTGLKNRLPFGKKRVRSK
ncbi:hypothetical protein [Bacillus toyonensis]|uniref:hypothetical protein n=1 Tax=Bacillus toyonensis TaxID=155322 RepID=UPI000BF80589|nr:hypothetical protein [Bacillus toyonensis]PGF05047.1 hypothetical protein COM61_01015 [Bacillus toyonensis]